MTTEQWERENQDTLMEYFIDGDPSVRRIQCEYCHKVIYASRGRAASISRASWLSLAFSICSTLFQSIDRHTQARLRTSLFCFLLYQLSLWWVKYRAQPEAIST